LKFRPYSLCNYINITLPNSSNSLSSISFKPDVLILYLRYLHGIVKSCIVAVLPDSKKINRIIPNHGGATSPPKRLLFPKNTISWRQRPASAPFTDGLATLPAFILGLLGSYLQQQQFLLEERQQRPLIGGIGHEKWRCRKGKAAT